MKSLSILLWLVCLSASAMGHALGQDVDRLSPYLVSPNTPERARVYELVERFTAGTTPTPDAELRALAIEAVRGKNLRLTEALLHNSASWQSLLSATKELDAPPDFVDEMLLMVLRVPWDAEDLPGAGNAMRTSRASSFPLYLPTLNRHLGHFDLVRDCKMLDTRSQRLAVARRLEEALVKKKAATTSAAPGPQQSQLGQESVLPQKSSRAEMSEAPANTKTEFFASWWWVISLVGLATLVAILMLRARYRR